MIFEHKEPDIDLLIKCLIENGCTVTKAKDGEGGIYLKGKKLTDEELMDCIMHPWEDSETMSILIKGMEMPSRRESCPFCSVVANDEPLCDLLVGELCLFGVACPLVPVVRCGECKHWKRIRNNCFLASCELDDFVRSEDFFCADGERKDGES